MQVSFSDIYEELNIPSVSASSSLAGLLYEFGEKLKRKLSVCTPAIVCNYEPETGTAYVRPLIESADIADVGQMEPMLRVTVIQHQHGGFFMHAPLFVGDTGWLITADTDTDLVKERNSFVQGATSGIGVRDEKTGMPLSNQGPQVQENEVFHEIGQCQGFFIPDKWGGVYIPQEYKDAFVLQQISPLHTSTGRFVLDQDGNIHIMSTKWKDKENNERGGLVRVDLQYKWHDEKTNKDSWDAGSIAKLAHETILGDVTISTWKDDNDIEHGGNLTVAKNASVGKNLEVDGSGDFRGDVHVAGKSNFDEVLTVRTDGKAAIIDPKEDLYKTDARFREITVLIGKKEEKDGKVKLKARKMRVLADEPEKVKDVEFGVGEGGISSGELVVEPFYMRRQFAGSEDFVCYLPLYSLMFNGKFVSFTGIYEFSTDEPDWYTLKDLHGLGMNDEIWCYITQDEQGEEYTGHFAKGDESDIKEIPGNIAYFAVAKILDNSGTEFYDGIRQLAAGEMVIGKPINAVPFDLIYGSEKDDENNQRAVVKVANPTFYWDGISISVERILQYNQDDLKNEHLYLNRFRKTDGDKLGPWQHELDLQDNIAKGQDGNGGFSYILYDFDNAGFIKTDYRHSFLELNGDVETDDISIKFHTPNQGNDQLAIKGWHTQKDVNGQGVIPPQAKDDEESEGEYNPEQEAGGENDITIDNIVHERAGQKYSTYQVIARQSPGGHLVYIPIGGSTGGETGGGGGGSTGPTGWTGWTGPSWQLPAEITYVKEVKYNRQPANEHKLEEHIYKLKPNGQAEEVGWNEITQAVPCGCTGGGGGGDTGPTGWTGYTGWTGPRSFTNPLWIDDNPTSSEGATVSDISYDGTAGATLCLGGLMTKGTEQTITGTKEFSGAYLRFATSEGRITITGFSQSYGIGIYGGDNTNGKQILVASGEVITIGNTTSGDNFAIVRLGISPTNAPSSLNTYTGRNVATLSWVDNYYQRKRTATREYVSDIKFDTSDHTLKKRVMVEAIDGSVSPKTGTGYSDGWTTIENGTTVSISSIIPQS